MYRLAVAVLKAAEEGTNPTVLSRYMEAWLLKLHGLYPPAARCVTCEKPLPAGPLRYHHTAKAFRCEACGPVSGPVLSNESRQFLADVFKNPPAGVKTPLPSDVGALASFHQGLIEAHLERDLRSVRVLKDIAREGMA
jgi:recombinational DNA repair protein (RecF pathway)